MSSSDRRTFFKVAGAGAVAAGAAAVIPAAAAGTVSGAAVAAAPAALPKGATGAMAAYIPDLSSGQVVVMVEGREVTVTDHALVAGLAQAVHGSHTA